MIRSVANRRTSSPGGKSPCAVIKDYGNPILGLDQLALEIKPVDSWQSDVEDEAASNIREEDEREHECGGHSPRIDAT